MPWWLRQWRVCLQCGRPVFGPWVGKILWRRKWQPTPVFFLGESRGWRSLTGYSPWGCKELDTTERLHFHFHVSIEVCVCLKLILYTHIHFFFLGNCYKLEMMQVEKSNYSCTIIAKLEYLGKSVRNVLNLCLSFFLHSVTVKSFQKIMLLLSLKYSHFIERNLSLLKLIIALLKICLIQILL